MDDNDRDRMFALLKQGFNKALSGEFDPEKGCLKLVKNLETGENQMIYIPPASGKAYFACKNNETKHLHLWVGEPEGWKCTEESDLIPR